MEIIGLVTYGNTLYLERIRKVYSRMFLGVMTTTTTTLKPGHTQAGTPAKGGSAESKAIMDTMFGLSKRDEATYDYPDVGTTTTGKTYTDYQDFLDMLEGFGPQDLGKGASATYGYDDPLVLIV